MSLDNFIPTVWSGRLLKQLDRKHVLVNVCNRDYEGEISDLGDTVKINSIGDISVNDYTKNSTSVSAETLTDASTQLSIDQSKYFAFQVDDVDQVQQKPKVMNRAMDKAGVALADTADSYVAGLHGDAGTSLTADLDSVTIFDALADIKGSLMENDVPASMDLWYVIDPHTYTDAIADEIEDSTDNVERIREGSVGRLYGFDIFVSNNLKYNSSDPYTLAGTYDAIAYAEQINSVEAYRPESKFADAVKGLHLYGSKVIRPKQLVRSEITYA